jgi:CRP-like cAMP-binding protein
MSPEDWEIIRTTPLFGTLSDAEAKALIADLEPHQFEKGAVLFHQGDPASSFFVLLDGWVKLFQIMPDGKEVVVGVFRRGETFAEVAMFLGGRYPVTAQAVTSCRLLRINGESMRRKIREQPDFALSMLASASHHLKSLVEQIAQRKVMSAPKRVADFLLRLCSCKQGPCTVELPYEKALIAGRLGMKPGSLSRALANLQAFGVTVDRELVSIADVQRLARYAREGDDDKQTG